MKTKDLKTEFLLMLTILSIFSIAFSTIAIPFSSKDDRDRVVPTTIPTTIPRCTDSDGGKNYSVKGTVIDIYGRRHMDNCFGKYLKEFYCTKYGSANFTYYYCPNGCSNGTCKSVIKIRNCTDSDGGKNYYVWGKVIDKNGQEHVDWCVGSRLEEFYCNENGTAESIYYFCYYGCAHGACLNKSPCSDTDGGKNYYVKGTLRTKYGVEIADQCINRSSLREYYCEDDGGVGMVDYTCTYACSDGACIFESECEKHGGVCIYWQDDCPEGYEDSGYRCISKSEKCCIPVRDFVDVTVMPEVRYASLGEKAIYKINIKDKHPLLRYGYLEGCVNETYRCPNIYYIYKLSVSGLPFPTDYIKEIKVYQGDSKTVELIVKPEYTGRFYFTVTATQINDETVSDSDSATLIVNGYINCDEACRSRGYEYGVCRTSCMSDERNIGRGYCKQFWYNEPSVLENTTDVIQKTAYMEAGIGKTEKIPEYYRPVYCCCGKKELTIKVWTNKKTYGSGENVMIYAKVLYTDGTYGEAEVYGTITRPDNKREHIYFRQICSVKEMENILKTKNETTKIQKEVICNAERCIPQCIYVANYPKTDIPGMYRITVTATTPDGKEAKTGTYFYVREPLITCNEYCQSLGYHYGTCKTRCNENEYDTGSRYCYEAIYPPFHCCCGKITPPQPPGEIIRIHLNRGWNLITLPGKGGELNKGNCERMYGFVYMNNRYYTIKEAEEKLGSDALREYMRLHSFWIYTFKRCYLEFKLVEYTSYTELKLNNGWNFIPITEDMVGKSLSDIKGNCSFRKVYIWNAEKQIWDMLSESYVFKRNDLPNGFVVYAEEDCGFGSIMMPPPLPEGE